MCDAAKIVSNRVDNLQVFGLKKNLSDVDKIAKEEFSKLIDDFCYKEVNSANPQRALVIVDEGERFLNKGSPLAASFKTHTGGNPNRAIYFVATTNKPEDFEVAIIRDRWLPHYVGYPDPPSRKQALKRNFGMYHLLDDEKAMDFIVKNTEWRNNLQLENLCKELERRCGQAGEGPHKVTVDIAAEVLKIDELKDRSSDDLDRQLINIDRFGSINLEDY